MTRTGTRTELALLARTAVHLKPSQAAQRARLRTQRGALNHWPQVGRWLLAGPDPASAVGWPAGFSPLDARTGHQWEGLGRTLRTGRIELLGMARTLAPLAAPPQAQRARADWGHADWGHADWGHADWGHADWEQVGMPRLWRFHLHYWDWAWALAAEPDRAGAQTLFAALWESWQRAVVAGRGNAWLPYPAALRAWSYCGLHRDLVAGSEIEDRFVADLAAHAGFLRRHLESDVGGNHLVKDLKALIGLAVFLADDRLLARAHNRLMGQLPVQILPDGGHYERAPAYHCQVLADLIDVAGLLRATGRTPEPVLLLAIRRMRRWLGSVLSPGGSVPLLNDGFPVGADLLAALLPSPPRDAAEPAPPRDAAELTPPRDAAELTPPRDAAELTGPPDQRLLALPDTGLVRATAGRWHLLADIGLPGPDELPAHAHADTFSFLLHVDGRPLLVDVGTSTYAPGPQRGYERSTAAHNTVEVDSSDSTEVWGTFRAARRARVRDVVTSAGGGAVTIAASHDGFRGLRGRPGHRRRWSLTETGLTVDDLVTGRGRHSITIRWHLAPGAQVRLIEGGAIVTTAAGGFLASVRATATAMLSSESGPVATGFGRTVAAPVLTCRLTAALPVEVSTGWRRAETGQPPDAVAVATRAREATQPPDAVAVATRAGEATTGLTTPQPVAAGIGGAT